MVIRVEFENFKLVVAKKLFAGMNVWIEWLIFRLVCEANDFFVPII